MTFKGFPDSESFTRLPETFFRELLAEIGDRAELKVTLFFLWQAEHMEGPYRALRQADFEEQAAATMGLSPDEAAYGLKKAARRGTILTVEREADVLYFLNSPRGRAAAEALTRGAQQGEEEASQAESQSPSQGEPREPETIQPAPAVEQPNLFKLYEEMIGPLTPMIADMLKDAEETYSQELVLEALEIAVKKNIRNWKYVEAILKRWKETGEHERKDRKDAVKGSERYTQSEFEEYLKRN